MERNVRILAACVTTLAVLTAIIGLPLPAALIDLMPGIGPLLAGIRNAGGQDAASMVLDTISTAIVAFIAWATYFLPAAIALQSRHPHQRPILWVNLFLGWTIVGWFAAFAWVMRGNET
ncbi:MAG: superinfection immunity protein [Zoogloeaceae bacterium]|jgi:hypothetical protein|nr:superinfection immunity protein [Zoogloeaceae bacterium]